MAQANNTMKVRRIKENLYQVETVRGSKTLTLNVQVVSEEASRLVGRSLNTKHDDVPMTGTYVPCSNPGKR
jgi:hypothetical protein